MMTMMTSIIKTTTATTTPAMRAMSISSCDSEVVLCVVVGTVMVSYNVTHKNY